MTISNLYDKYMTISRVISCFVSKNGRYRVNEPNHIKSDEISNFIENFGRTNFFTKRAFSEPGRFGAMFQNFKGSKD